MSVWEKLGDPIHVVSPMVDSSEFAFRQLTRNYDAQLCYTPMIHAKMFMNDLTYQRQRFDHHEGETHLVAQIAGNDPKIMLAAAQIVEKKVVAVDMNCGCPQPIARKGHYGASLLREPDTICEVLRTWKASLSCAVTCKIRILDEGSKDPTQNVLQATIRLAQEIEAAGADFLTIHGRTRHMSGKHTGQANWQHIAAIRNHLNIPVIAYGGIESYSDITECLKITGCPAVLCVS